MSRRFRRPKDMKNYLGDVKFEVDFDAYYLFCMYGIAQNEKREPNSSVAMTPEYPQSYRNSREVISVSVLVASMIAEGIDTKESKGLRSYFNQVLHKDKSTNPLSDSGVSKMDAFANKGFIEFKKQFPKCPRTMSSFLYTMFNAIDKAFKQKNIYPQKA